MHLLSQRGDLRQKIITWSGFRIVGFLLVFRYPFVSTPMCSRYISLCFSFILRSFSVRSSIGKRRTNGERTENERRTNGERTENERRTNGERTENDAENIPSELLGGLQYCFIVNNFSGVNKSRFGDITLSTTKNQQNHVAHLSDFSLPSHKIKDEI